MIPAEEVTPHFVFNNQDQTVQAGATISGPVTTITIDDIISLFGSRVPNATNSPKQFKIGTIIISNSLLTVKEMSFYTYYTKRAELMQETLVREGLALYTSKPFFLSTGQRGSLVTTLTE